MHVFNLADSPAEKRRYCKSMKLLNTTFQASGKKSSESKILKKKIFLFFHKG